MRYLVLTDLHANLEATEAVLQDAQEKECTHFVCLGDLVGYNANPHECVEIVRALDCTNVTLRRLAVGSFLPVRRSVRGLRRSAAAARRS